MRAAIQKVTTEKVILELSIQEAHLIDSLLGCTPDEVGREFGVKSLMATWSALNKALGSPVGRPIQIQRGGK